MDYNHIFRKVMKKLAAFNDKGEVASYVPELKKVNAEKTGICLITNDGQEFSYGDYQEKFSIQSISKVLSLILAYKKEGGNLWKRVGVEPSGTPFNSLIQLESDRGIPRNPFINPGAIVIADILFDHYKDPLKEVLKLIRKTSNNPNIDINIRVARSEKVMGYKNVALINLMRSYGNIHNNITKVMDFYFRLCSIEMSCKDLANSFLFLASQGKHPKTGKKILTASQSKRINSIMLTCGFYDQSGDFAYKVGLPGKSGVGGGIVGVYPNNYCIAVWSPRLNKKGNSSKGMKILELLTDETKSTIF